MTTDYVYLTDGRKLTANFNGREALEYLGSFVYLRNAQGVLSMESTDFLAGRIENSTAGYKVNYHITDNLSSVRAIATSTRGGTAPTITSRMDYHPFGTPHVSSSLPTADQKHRYTFCGKEEQCIAKSIPVQFRVAVMDQGARYYIPSTMQFTSQDPLAIKYPHVSPYAYCAANPILYIDPDGMDWFTATYNGESFFYYDSRVKNQNDVDRYYGGTDTPIKYLGESETIEGKDKDGNIVKTFVLYSDGSLSINDKKTNSEFHQDGLLHIGNAKNSSPNNKKGNNLFGSFYIGSNNPKDKKENDYYGLIPVSPLDYAAYKHDKAYDKSGSKGLLGALFDIETTKSDYELAKSAFNYETGTGYSVGLSFGTIFVIKYSILNIKNAINK